MGVALASIATMTTWTMYYGPHPVQSGITFVRAEQLANQWELALAQGSTWFTFSTLVPGSVESAEVKLRASREASVAFIPDSPAH